MAHIEAHTDSPWTRQRATRILCAVLKDARQIVSEVAKVTGKWRKVAVGAGASNAAIQRMASAFEHDDLRRALAF